MIPGKRLSHSLHTLTRRVDGAPRDAPLLSALRAQECSPESVTATPKGLWRTRLRSGSSGQEERAPAATCQARPPREEEPLLCFVPKKTSSRSPGSHGSQTAWAGDWSPFHCHCAAPTARFSTAVSLALNRPRCEKDDLTAVKLSPSDSAPQLPAAPGPWL